MKREKYNSGLKLADYRRVSTLEQTDNHSLETQGRFNESLISKLEAIAVGPFVDAGQSAFHRNPQHRPAIRDMLDAARNGLIDGMVFFDVSRVTRQIAEIYSDLFVPLKEINPKFIFFMSSTGQEWDPNSIEAQQHLIQSYAESAKKAATARHSMQSKLQRKEKPGGKLPVGISSIEENRLIPSSDFPIVVLVFTLTSRGYSERRIANVLQELFQTEPFSLLPCASMAWSHTTVHHILYNTFYTGDLRWNRRIAKSNSRPKNPDDQVRYKKLPPLLPPGLWELAHQAIGKRWEVPTDTSFHLSSLLRCARCNIDLVTRNSLKKNSTGEIAKKNRNGEPLQYYYCPSCLKRIGVDEIHDFVRDRVQGSLNGQFTKQKIKRRINAWIKTVEESDRHIQSEWHALNSQKQRFELERDQFDEFTRSKMKNHFDMARMDIEQKRLDTRNVCERLKLMNEHTVFDVLLKRTQRSIDELPSIERRYLYLSILESVSVYWIQGKEPAISLDLRFRDVPMPFDFEKHSKELGV